jgi:hypothetical protein
LTQNCSLDYPDFAHIHAFVQPTPDERIAGAMPVIGARICRLDGLVVLVQQIKAAELPNTWIDSCWPADG